MASYIEQSLVASERVTYNGRISLWMVSHLIAVGVLLLPAFGLGLIFLAVAYVRHRSTELAITNRRVILKTGFISRHTNEINLVKVESIQVQQNLFGRIFDYGTVVIAGTGMGHAPIVGIAQPIAFRRAFMEAQESAGVKK